MGTADHLPQRWRTRPGEAHDAHALVAVLDTPSIAPRTDGLAILARIGSREVLPFLVAAKSLRSRLGRGRIVILDDGTLSGADRTILACHCGDPEILRRDAVPLGGFPAGLGWEPLLAALDRRRGEYGLVLDPLAVASGPVPQVARALGANRSLVAGAALTGFAAGGPARPEAAALFAALGEPAAPARAALDLLMAREAAPVALAEAQGIAHFGPGEAAAHAEASRRAIAELRGSG